MQTINLLYQYFSLRAFLQALVIFILIILSFAAIAYFNADKTIQKIEYSLAARTVLVDNLNYGSALDISPVEVAGNGDENTTDEEIEQPVSATQPSMNDIETYQSLKDRDSLYPAPIRGLFERTPIGPLPIISSNGITPFDAYKKPFKPTGKPLIAIAIMDYGLNEALAKKMRYSLPDNITFLLSPYAPKSRTELSQAREYGFETWLYIPVENGSFFDEDPGKGVLMSHYSISDNTAKLHWLMTRGAGYAGVAMESDELMHRGKNFSELASTEIFDRGLSVFEINPQAPIALDALAAETGQGVVRNQYFLNQISLKTLEKTARENGYAVGVIEAYPKSIEALETWTSTLDSKGFSIAPLSAIKKLQD